MSDARHNRSVDADTLCRWASSRLTPLRRVYTLEPWSSPGPRRSAQRTSRHTGIDFVDAPLVFEGATFTFEDDRFSYGEQRFVALGLLAGIPVSVVHTESESEIRIISFRQATTREAQIYFSEIQD